MPATLVYGPIHGPETAVQLPSLASVNVINTPVAISPDRAELLIAALAARTGIAPPTLEGRRITPRALGDEDERLDRIAKSWGTPGYTVVAGVAIIPVRGVLVQRLGFLGCSWITGYDGLRYAVMSALADTNVDALVLDIDSPGGEVAGCFDFVDTLYAARGIKPIWAILNEAAYSAAYAIASACDRITVPRTGGVGSVGVICMHMDVSKALDKAGVQVTLITYGKHKADGSSYKPLEDGALSRFQADVDDMGELFVATVARNRGLDAKTVRDGDAGVYLGMKGVTAGLADEVLSPDAAFRKLLAELASKRKK